MQTEISAGIIVYRKTHQGLRFLLLYHGGKYWNFPKGHIEAEERSLQTAIRETVEESGLKRIDLKINNTFKAYEKFVFFRDKTKIFKTVIFYLAETRNREIKISREHEGFGWFSYKEAINLLQKHKDSAALLKRANYFIQRPFLQHAPAKAANPEPKQQSS